MKDIPKEIQAWCVETAAMIWQKILDITLTPDNINKIKLASILWSKETGMAAPQRGKADEELDQITKNTGMTDIKLPETFNIK